MKKSLLILLAVFFNHTAFATIWMVDNNPNSPFPLSDVQVAIDNADPTDTIMVVGSAAGYGDVYIHKPLVLIGEGISSFFIDTVNFGRITIRSSNVVVTGVISAFSLDAYNSAGNEIRHVTIERCKIRKSGNGHLLKFLGLLNTSSGYGYFNNIIVRNNVIVSGSITFNLGTTGPSDTTRTQLDTVTFENNIFSESNFERYINNDDCIGLSTLTIKNNVFINGSWTSGYVSVFNHGSNSNRRMQDAILKNNIFYGTNASGCDSCVYNNNLTYFTSNDTITSTNAYSGNIIGDPKFINYPGGDFSFSYNFNLDTGSIALHAGLDSTNIGSTGGSFPFSIGEGPKVPLVDYVNISASSGQQPQYFLQFDAQTRTDVLYSGTQITNDDSVPVVNAEYWIDTIPIPGTGKVIACNPLDTIFYNDSIPGQALDTGVHVVSVRARNSLGNWGFIKTDTIRNEYYDVDFTVLHQPFIRPNTKTKFKITFKNRSSVDIVEKYLLMKFPKDFNVEFENLGDSINGVDVSNVSKTIFVDGDNPYYVMPMWVGKLPKYQSISYNIYVTFPELARVNKYIGFELFEPIKSQLQQYYELSGADSSIFLSLYAGSLVNSIDVLRDTLVLDTLNYTILNDSLQHWLVNNNTLFNNLMPLNIFSKFYLTDCFNVFYNDSIINKINLSVFNIFNFSTFNVGSLGSDTTSLTSIIDRQINPDCNCATPLSLNYTPSPPLVPSSQYYMSSGCQKRCRCDCTDVNGKQKWNRVDESTHRAVDLANWDITDINWYTCGTPVRSMVNNGTAIQKYDETRGYQVQINFLDNNGTAFNIRYLHLCETGRASGIVNAGDIIGYVGRTGNGANGVHLHIESDFFPPSCIMNFENVYPPLDPNDALNDQPCKPLIPGDECHFSEKEGDCTDPTKFFYSQDGTCEPEGIKKKKCNSITPIGASDPNDKVGNEGYAVPRYIKPTDELNYGIFFENVDSATAPAQVVHIADTLDLTKVDASTFYFESITAGEMLIVIPDSIHVQNLDTIFMDEAVNGCYVHVQASFNATTGAVDLLLTSLDTFPPYNPVQGATAGFLPPDTTNFHGNGLVSFKVMPVSTIPDNTVIYNTANIIFDSNPAIQTGTWFNTIDRISPKSWVIALPAITNDTSFAVNWMSDADSSGIAGYDVYVKLIGDTVFTKWLSYTSLTTDTFHGIWDSTYQFYSIAYDSVGNMENKADTVEAFTTLQNPNGIQYIHNTTSLRVYPNPTIGKLTIEATLSKDGKLHVEVFDLLSQKIISFDDYGTGQTHLKREIDLSNQADGVYFISLNNSGDRITKKFILKKD